MKTIHARIGGLEPSDLEAFASQVSVIGFESSRAEIVLEKLENEAITDLAAGELAIVSFTEGEYRFVIALFPPLSSGRQQLDNVARADAVTMSCQATLADEFPIAAQSALQILKGGARRVPVALDHLDVMVRVDEHDAKRMLSGERVRLVDPTSQLPLIEGQNGPVYLYVPADQIPRPSGQVSYNRLH